MVSVFLLLLFLAISFLYVPLNKRKSRYYFQLPFDRYIPIIPVFVIAYVAYYPFMLASIVVLWHTPYIESLLKTQIVVTVCADIFWFIFPNGVKRKFLVEESIWTRIINWFYTHDGDSNGFPSGHVFHTIVSSIFFWRAFPDWGVVIAIAATLIVCSTVLVKQHYIVDVVGGIAWAMTALLVFR